MRPPDKVEISGIPLIPAGVWPGEEEYLLPQQGQGDVEHLCISSCDGYLAYSINQEGISYLRLLTTGEHQPLIIP